MDDAITQSFWGTSQQLQQVESKIARDAVSPTARVELNKELEGVHSQIRSLKEAAKASKGVAKMLFDQIAELEKRLVSLYGKIEDRFEEFEIDLIAKEALEVSDDVERGDLERVAAQVDALKNNIQFLLYNRRPSMKNRKIIKLADELGAKALEIAKNPEQYDEQTRIHLIVMLRQLLMESIRAAEAKPLQSDVELAMELYEIAGLYYKHKRDEGRLRLNQLMSLLSDDEQKQLLGLESVSAMVKALLKLSQKYSSGLLEEIDPEEVFGFKSAKAQILTF